MFVTDEEARRLDDLCEDGIFDVLMSGRMKRRDERFGKVWRIFGGWLREDSGLGADDVLLSCLCGNIDEYLADRIGEWCEVNIFHEWTPDRVGIGEDGKAMLDVLGIAVEQNCIIPDEVDER